MYSKVYVKYSIYICKVINKKQIPMPLILTKKKENFEKLQQAQNEKPKIVFQLLEDEI